MTMRLILVFILILLNGAIFASDANNHKATKVETHQKIIAVHVSNEEDPLESFNRASFRLNDTLDKIIFRPIASLYNWIIPPPLAKGLSNIFGNITDIPTIP